MLLVREGYTYAMETSTHTERYELWLTSGNLLVETIWPLQVVHQLITYNEQEKVIASSRCIMPRSRDIMPSPRISDVMLEITNGCFNCTQQQEWEQTKNHVKTMFSHLSMRNFTRIYIQDLGIAI